MSARNDHAAPPPPRVALRGDVLDIARTPAWGHTECPSVRWRPDHWVLMEGGRIQAIQDRAPTDLSAWEVHDHAGRLILPGFIDTHVHSPQLDVIASFGTQLLDWLNEYTFPAERAYADPVTARAGTERFVSALLAHGTTAAVVFPTVHAASVDALCTSALGRHMRMITGKVLMDRHAPDGLRDDVTQAEADCRRLIHDWHGRGRLSYAVTVRFAPTSTPEQLAMAGRLCQENPTLYMQTHVAENRDEVRWVAELYPEARSYLDVYARAGLLHPRSVLAHGIWLDRDDHALLARHGAQIAHSPTSNLFLGSGLFPWRTLQDRSVPVSVASDVGGGTSLCLLRNLAAAYQIQALQGERLTAWSALAGATVDAAASLGLANEIGRVEPGLMADLTVWDWARDPVTTHRLGRAKNLHERVFAWMTLADERHLVHTWVAGRLQFNRPTPSAPTEHVAS